MCYNNIKRKEENMKAHFIFDTPEGQICTFQNIPINFEFRERLQHKRKILIYPELVQDNSCYKYSVKAKDNKVYLTVLKGTFNHNFIWEEIFWASIDNSFNYSEHGDCDIEFWHEFFKVYTSPKRKEEYDIPFFCLENDMTEVRKILPICFEQNAFIVFEKYKNIKKPDIKFYPKEWFNNVPGIKINKNVGKALDNTEKDMEPRHFCWQKEIYINGEIFFDVNVISGIVNNGIMDVKEKHRFFISKDFCYSPDGGDAGILVTPNTYGLFYYSNMAKKYPELMLDMYKGKHFYAYFFARHFLPAFEITAKAGLTVIADIIFDNFIKNCNSQNWYKAICDPLSDFDLYGKNDKAIFGLKISKLKFLDSYPYAPYHEFNYVYKQLMEVYQFNPSVVDAINCPELLDFAWLRHDDKDLPKEIIYLKKTGVNNFKTYNDYLNLCSQAKRASGGKYPVNLKFHHDVMVTFMREVREAIQNEGFKEQVNSEEYQKNVFIKNKYSILAPRFANDLVNESFNLSHCVRTYINDVAKGRTKIYFLRKSAQKSKSLVTIEVNNGRIVQARGKNNRFLTDDENKFMKMWAQEKGLIDVSNRMFY